MRSLFGELAFERVAVVIADIEAEFAADALQLAEFIAGAVGAVEVVVELLQVAPVERNEAGSVEFLRIELMSEKAGLGAVLNIDRLPFIGRIAVDIDAGLYIEADPLRNLIRGAKIDRLDTGVDAVKTGVVDQEFIAEVARNMIAAETEGPVS